MTERSRTKALAWAAVLLGLFVLVTILVQVGWQPLADLDDTGRTMHSWAMDEPGLPRLLRWIEVGFGTIGTITVTALLALALALNRHRRAAIYTVGVMLVTTQATKLIKRFIDRDRPPWQDASAHLDTLSYPSYHASTVTALAGIAIVLITMFVRRSAARHTLVALMVLTAVMVGLDRILLGRHYASDVLGGALLGAFVVVLGLALYSPLPQLHTDDPPPPLESLPGNRNLHVVLNPSKVEDPGQFESIVTAMAAESGWSIPTWHYTTVADPGTGMAERASIAGADLVLVCGGDGTAREVCAELAGTGIPVGIVPAGTGNLLARNLDIPLYLRAAVDVALNGQDRAIDMVAVSGDGIEDTHFMVMAGMGFDAAIMEGVNEDIKKRVGWLAYVLSALKSLMFPAVRVEVSIDGGEFSKHRARTILVGNVGYLQAGMPLLPDAAIDDGQLDVVLLHPQKFLSWIPLVFRVLAKRPHTDETINRMTGAKVVIRAATDTPRQLDGDSIGSGRELSMECLPGRLLVRVPR